MTRFAATIDTDRLTLRAVRMQHAQVINAAVNESFTELHEWMDWARKPNTMADTNAFCTEAERRFQAEETPSYGMWRTADDTFVGVIGCAALDWKVPALEIGYWCRTPLAGQGYVSEALRAFTRYAFASLAMVRVEIRMDTLNERSWRVAERAGFQQQALLTNHARNNRDELRDTRIYALTDASGLRG